MLQNLESGNIPNVTQHRRIFFKALILTALASGNRCSELAALKRVGIIISQGSITIPVHNTFLYKNQSLGRSPPPVRFPGIPNNALCPFEAVQNYITISDSLPHNDRLFVHPESGKPLTAGRLGYWLASAIKAIDGTIDARPHDFRKFAYSAHWARTNDIKEIIRHGFWSSSHPFIYHYLIKTPNVLSHFVAAGQITLTCLM